MSANSDPIPTPGPTASPKAVREAKKRSRFSRRQEIDDVRWVLSTRQGRRFARRLLAKCGVMTQADVESVNRVLVNEGKRSIGLWFVVEAEAADPMSLNEILFNQQDVTTQ